MINKEHHKFIYKSFTPLSFNPTRHQPMVKWNRNLQSITVLPPMECKQSYYNLLIDAAASHPNNSKI